MAIVINNTAQPAFVSPMPVHIGNSTALPSSCRKRVLTHVKSSRQPQKVLNRKTIVRAETSLAKTIVRALENEFRGKDITRVIQSFRDVISGNILEVGQGTPQHQRASSFVQGLEAVPFYDDFDDPSFKWVRHLEQNWTTIAKELALVTGQADIQEKGNNIWAPPVVEAANAYGPDWRTLVLQDRVWDPTNTLLFPETTRILQDKDVKVPSVEAFFARQSANTGIKLHTDDCNFIMTMHLPLKAPTQQSWIEVAGERRYWTDGKPLVFNTSFFHRTMNESNDEDRIVLLIRFWHPQLAEVERQALGFLFQVIDDPDSHPAVLRAQRQLLSEETTRGKKSIGSNLRSGGRGFGR